MTIVQWLITWEAIAGETIFFCGVGWGGLSGGAIILGASVVEAIARGGDNYPKELPCSQN